MRVIALMNQKGGVGKTTTTVNLGAALAELGKKVLLIDLDPQAHLTINYGVEPRPDVTSLYNVLVEETPLADAIHTFDPRISLVPSSIDLAAAEIELVGVLGREMILKKRLEAARLRAEEEARKTDLPEGQERFTFDYDFVLLDCPPSLGLLTINALAVAGEVIIPMQPHFLALQGVGKLLETVALVNRRTNPKLKVSGIVLTMFDSQTKLSNEVVNDLNGFIESAKGTPKPWAEARIYKSKIRRNIKLAESPSFGQTILKYEPTSNGAFDYRALAKEILAQSGDPAGEEPSAPAEPLTAPPAASLAAPLAAPLGPAAAANPALPPAPALAGSPGPASVAPRPAPSAEEPPPAPLVMGLAHDAPRPGRVPGAYAVPASPKGQAGEKAPPAAAKPAKPRKPRKPAAKKDSPAPQPAPPVPAAAPPPPAMAVFSTRRVVLDPAASAAAARNAGATEEAAGHHQAAPGDGEDDVAFEPRRGVRFDAGPRPHAADPSGTPREPVNRADAEKKAEEGEELLPQMDTDEHG